MSAVSGFSNIRTSTTLGLSSVITLAAVVFMAYSYFEQTRASAKFLQQSVEYNELNDSINSIRNSVQWVYSYENDVLAERIKQDPRSGAYLYWEKVNIFNRRGHMDEALVAMDKLESLLRTDEDRLLATDLRVSLDLHSNRLDKESARNLSNEKLAEEVMKSGSDKARVAIDLSVDKAMQDTISVLYALDNKVLQLETVVKRYRAEDREKLAQSNTKNTEYFYISCALIFAAILLSLLLFRAAIVRPLDVLMSTISRVREGDDEARTGMTGRGELVRLGGVLDELLDEKDESLKVQQQERETLNASVISLIQNVFKLSQRDLTIRVPVAEDITGAVSDSINQLADSIDSTLVDVTEVSEGVTKASSQIQSQSERVMAHSKKEKLEIQKTLEELDTVIRAMQMIAHLATASHTTSKEAINTSENAMSSVSETIISINRIRQTIAEAEKRIKRLGERSQEIGGIVSLINNISERTHVLSLNASMHAASAGEAGRGLTVVVDEVQRLAENSREATAEIETLVNNIQVETNDTIEVINTVITEVVNGTRLAEEAGNRMDSTREATHSLVEAVVKIAKSAVNQSKVARQLHQRTTTISESATETSREMERQTQLSKQLVQAAEKLQGSVSVFQLSDKTTD